jgi:uncharacterized OsmC-like protein
MRKKDLSRDLEEFEMSIRDAIANASRFLTENPDQAVYRDSPARARLSNGLATTVTGPDGAEARTDMPTSVGGGNAAPSHGWLLRAAEASCLATLVAMRAASEGIELRSVDVTVDSESNDLGILGLDADVPAGPLSTRVVVAIDAPGHPPVEIEALAGWALEHCPVTDAVARPVPIELQVVPAGG